MQSVIKKIICWIEIIMKKKVEHQTNEDIKERIWLYLALQEFKNEWPWLQQWTGILIRRNRLNAGWYLFIGLLVQITLLKIILLNTKYKVQNRILWITYSIYFQKPVGRKYLWNSGGMDRGCKGINSSIIIIIPSNFRNYIIMSE